MHCHLKLPVAPVVLSIKREASSVDRHGKIVPNFSAIGRFAAELLRFNNLQFGRCPLSWISAEGNSDNFAASWDQNAPIYQMQQNPLLLNENFSSPFLLG